MGAHAYHMLSHAMTVGQSPCPCPSHCVNGDGLFKEMLNFDGDRHGHGDGDGKWAGLKCLFTQFQ